MLDRAESGRRIGRLQETLRAQGLDAALFVFPIDVYYYAGTRQTSLLWVPAQGEPLLLVKKSLSRAQGEAAISDLRPWPSSKELPQLFDPACRKVGLTMDVLPVQQYNLYAKILAGRELIDISLLHREIKSVKSPLELERMRESGRALCGIFRQVPEFLTQGMREIDLAAEFECRLRKAGGEGYVRMRAFNQELFMGLVLSGTSADNPGFFDGAVTGVGLSNASPHGASRQPIGNNVPILLDYTGIFQGYHVDMTRIFSFGPLSAELNHAFQTSLAIQHHIVERLKPGVVCEDLFLAAARMAEEAGLSRYFMGVPGENARFVAHGVGLELDELPILAQGFKAPLQAGQTVALEPKFVIPGQGVIGIENTFAVTEQGGEKVTDLPDDILIL